MKWVKVAIGAVIAILSISIIVTSVYDMTQERVINDFEVITTTEVTQIEEESTIRRLHLTPNINNDLVKYDFNTLEGDVIFYIYRDSNVVFSSNVIIEDVNTTDDYIIEIEYNNTTATGHLGTVALGGKLGLPQTFVNYVGLEVGDTITITLENNYIQPPQLTGINATLILLAPLIFAGGVLAYLLNKQNY